MILWDKQMETGSRTIDEQHRMLINNLNHLECMLNATNPTREECEFLIQLVNFLESYAEKHFRFEEQCTERYRCPMHAKNKDAHGMFLTLFQRFKERCKTEGLRPDMIRALHQTLSLWIQEHIVKIDTQLKPCLKEGDPESPLAGANPIHTQNSENRITP